MKPSAKKSFKLIEDKNKSVPNNKSKSKISKAAPNKILPKINDKKNIISKTDNKQFLIVGIGASAGGLEALEQFFQNMPENNGMAFVVIQHLDPTHAGIMPELLQRITTMKVNQAKDALRVEPNKVYVIPPNKSMSILNGALHLFEPVESRELRLPIDTFFRSLADDKQDKSIGIILSGMGSDGSLGLKAIKEKGGIVLVQEPASAKFDSMPRNAIESVIIDIIAPAEELPTKLLAYLNFIPTAKVDFDLEIKNKSNLNKIIILIREQSGHDFSLYKKNTLFRRIERRKGIHQIDKISSYVKFLQEHPKEADILFKEMLIGVTSFFRDTKVWDTLKEKVLPELIEKAPNGHTLRAWVAGCSTGEEAYSLAIIFKELMEQNTNGKNIKLQIFATDLDHDAIEVARKGYFHQNITADVSEERISKFFSIEGEGYRMSSAIREMIVFAPQNMIKDPPFTKVDILTCRNVLIYMESELQKKVLELFKYCINTDGIMILGTAETLGNNTEGFIDIDNKLKIFKRNSTIIHSELVDFPSAFYRNKTITAEKNIILKPGNNIHTLADHILLQHYSPASVLVNAKGDIIYITGRTGKYLEPVAGKANWNVHVMAREGLRHELPGAFRKAMQDFAKVKLHNIKVGTNGDTQYVNVTIQRIENPDAIRGMIMIVFNDVPKIIEDNLKQLKTPKGNSTAREKKLAMNLQRSNEDLQSTLEEMQTSQEELKSTNEELQSTNEELQSTNEELTTSKEEMQSLNEELQTVNIELQSKATDSLRASNDMKNLLNSTEIATLFLDKDLNIRRFTESVTAIAKLRKVDIGRPFTDMVNDLQYPELDKHAKDVLRTLVSKEMAIVTNDQRWFNVRIMPYRTIDDRIDGLVITFTNITASKKLEIELALIAKEKEEARIKLTETAKQLAIKNLKKNKLEK